MITAVKHCLTCQATLHGRTDKKFCNDYCRNTHHNTLHSDGNNCMRNINHSLRRNRHILENLLPATKPLTRISRDLLQRKGFSFHYFTHQLPNRKGHPVFFCYDYGYRVLGKEWVMVVRGTEQMNR